MKNDVNNTTEKLGVNKDETLSSDNKEHRNTKIVNISMTVKRWYSVANLIYSLLVGYETKGGLLKEHVKKAKRILKWN